VRAARQIWSLWATIIGAIWGLLGFLIFIRDDVLPRYLQGKALQEWQGRIVLLRLSWQLWAIVALVLLLVLGFEGAYRVILARDDRITQLEKQTAQAPAVYNDHVDALKSVLEKVDAYIPWVTPSAEERLLEACLRQHEPDSPLWADITEYHRLTDQQAADERQVDDAIRAETNARSLDPLQGAEGAFQNYFKALRKGAPSADFGEWWYDDSGGLRLKNPFATAYQFANVFIPKTEDERERRREQDRLKAAFEEVWDIIPTLPVLARLRHEDGEIARLLNAIRKESAVLRFRTAFTKPTCSLCAPRRGSGP